MKNGKWIYLGLASLLALLIMATAIYADPVIPGMNFRGGDDGVALRGGRGICDGSGRQQRQGKRTRRGKRGRNGRRGKRYEFVQALNLTDGQKDEIKSIWDNHKDSLANIGLEMKDAWVDFRDLKRADDFDEDAIRDAAYAMADYRVDIAVEMNGIRKEIRGILSDEQLDTIAQYRDEWCGLIPAGECIVE
jgi:Spy/CpxP family protein refolding chaperone